MEVIIRLPFKKPVLSAKKPSDTRHIKPSGIESYLYNSQIWTKAMDALILKEMGQEDPNWGNVARELNVSIEECLERLDKVMKEKLSKARSMSISQSGSSDIQFSNIPLNPNNLTASQEERIVEIVESLSYDWSRIGKSLKMLPQDARRIYYFLKEGKRVNSSFNGNSSKSIITPIESPSREVDSPEIFSDEGSLSNSALEQAFLELQDNEAILLE